MTPDNPPSRLKASLVVLTLLWLGFLLARSGGLGYSYWLDELYSVTASEQSYGTLLTFILSDVHPPLYQLALKWWGSAFGNGEVASRAMSLGAMAIGLLWFMLRARLSSPEATLFASLFMTSSPLVAYFSQEARSYGLLFALGSVLTVLYLNRAASSVGGLAWTLLVGFLLSVTHYFGLLFAGCVFFLLLLENFSNKRRLIIITASGLLALAWPIFHMLGGDLGSKTGGNFWIKLPPVSGTLGVAGAGLAFWGQFSQQFGGLLSIVGKHALFVGLLGWAGTRLACELTTGRREATVLSPLVRAASLLLIFLLVVTLVDIKTPMSTPRNYIVAVPVFSAVLGELLYTLVCRYGRIRWVFFSLALLICAASLQESARRIEVKSSPLEDWRALSQRAASMVATKKLYFYALDDGPSNLRWQALVNNFYLCGTEAATPCADRWGKNGPQVREDAVVFYQHLDEASQQAFEASLTGYAVVERQCVRQSATAKGCALRLEPL